MTRFWVWAIYSMCFLAPVLVHGEDGGAFVITTEANGKADASPKEGTTEVQSEPKIYEMQVDSNITNRFARTLISSKVRNLNTVAKEATFSVILPDKAFISEFVMVIDGKSYKAYVKEKEEAKNIYDQAVASGAGAAHVAVSARESNRFTVSVNVEPQSKATFLLTYEELLRRKENMYELIINIHPKQTVKDLFVNVLIDESRPLKFVRTPALRSGNEITKGEGDLDPRSDYQQINATSAIVKFKPNLERQKELATNLGTDVNEGLSGQFVVQYDVERDPNGGEVLVQDGYFVHFFAPSELKPLNKFIIFVLDTSGSMWGQKMPQLKEAMTTILDQLDPKDYFHIVGFESNIRVWNIQHPENSTESQTRYSWDGNSQPDAVLSDMHFPPASSVNPDNIKKAKEVISQLQPRGGTNVYEALKIALILIEREKTSGVHKHLPQPMIMFLTDGDPTVGITSRDIIVTDVTKSNKQKSPIFSLSFGEDADKTFLKKLSLQNQAFSRHIYEASDAALQLRNFYKEIASPLLSDVKFEYVPETTSLTKTIFPIHFGGSELVVSGRLGTPTFLKSPIVICFGEAGPIKLEPIIERPVTSLERLWAYLTVQQLLDDRETALNKTVNEKKALDLALQYSFVTPVSSLVVVKPNTTDASVNPEAADKGSIDNGYSSAALGVPLSISGGFAPMYGMRGPSLLPPGFPASSIYANSVSRVAYEPHLLPEGAILPTLKGDSSGPLTPYRPHTTTTSSMTTTSPIRTIINASESQDILSILKSALPWLSSVLNDDGSLKTPFALSAAEQGVSLDRIFGGARPASNYWTTPVAVYDSDSVVDFRIESSQPVDKLMLTLPWLAGVLNADDSFKAPIEGYLLGLNETSVTPTSCTKTPTNTTTGNCTLLHLCPQVHDLLISADVFYNFFCPIDKKFVLFKKRKLTRKGNGNKISSAPSPISEKLAQLKLVLPWLSDILNVDGTLKPPKEGYQLGLDEPIMPVSECSKTPTNTTGTCTFLHVCPQVHNLLTSVEVFWKFFCPIDNKFVGICCP